jgi:hypothetical protein
MHPATNGSSVFFYSPDVQHFATWRKNIVFLKNKWFWRFLLAGFCQKKKSEKSQDLNTILRYVGPRMFRFF